MKPGSGQSLLALVILIGGIVAVIVVALAFSVYAFLASEYGYQSAGSAEVVATAGVEDALLMLDRNVAFSSSGYSLPVGSSTATVSVTQNTPSSSDITILSKATISISTRKVQVIMEDNASTSQLTVMSWQDVQ